MRRSASFHGAHDFRRSDLVYSGGMDNPPCISHPPPTSVAPMSQASCETSDDFVESEV